jgi:hypothetical protein
MLQVLHPPRPVVGETEAKRSAKDEEEVKDHSRVV